jgi:methyl-accepting chemotaxis protein
MNDSLKTLSSRLDFVEMSDHQRQMLRENRSLLSELVPIALGRFYDKLRKEPQMAHFFSDDAHISRAKTAQIDHWDGIASGVYDQNYVNHVTRVGKIHARIGLEPRWYIGGYALVLETLIKDVLERLQRRQNFFQRNRGSTDSRGEIIGVIVKAALIDMDFAISVYLDASEEMRKAQEAEINDERTKVMSMIGDAIKQLADMDLRARISADIPSAYHKLRTDFNDSVGKIEDLLSGISSVAQAVRSGASEITQATEDLAKRSETQAASLEESSAALAELTNGVARSAENARKVDGVVAKARAEAEASGQIVRQAVTAMERIDESSRQISQIIGVIDEISFQTNLLALNAGVEAARAGDAGRGFAVVASEVRALAQRSAGAAKEIKALITTSAEQVGSGVKLVGETGMALGRIIDRVSEMTSLVSDIAKTAGEQASGLGEISLAINSMDQTTQQNAAMVEQSSAASHELTRQAEEMSGQVARFRIGNVAMRSSSSNAGTERKGGPPLQSPVHSQLKRAATFAAGHSNNTANVMSGDGDDF